MCNQITCTLIYINNGLKRMKDLKSNLLLLINKNETQKHNSLINEMHSSDE